jgi:phosphoserine phosphatase
VKKNIIVVDIFLGRVLGGIVDARKKADLLNVIASQEGIAREQVMMLLPPSKSNSSQYTTRLQCR